MFVQLWSFLSLGAECEPNLRARSLTLHPHLHLHFYIRYADADAGKCPTQHGITQMWMKKFPGGAELHALPQFMHEVC
jgi:hypothetical protein